MGRHRYWSVRSYLRCMPLLFAVCLDDGGSAHAACYATPSAVVDAVRTGSSLSAVSGNVGYRLTEIRSDPILGDRWAMVGSCDHPDWPARLVELRGAVTAVTSLQRTNVSFDHAYAAPVVRAGDIVRLWRQEDLLRIEVSAVSEQSGGLGKTIRLRLLRRETEESETQLEISGIVRGPSDVEMQP